MNKPNETRDHYETMARAALYPELVKALERISKLHPNELPDGSRWTAAHCLGVAQEIADELLSRLPADDAVIDETAAVINDASIYDFQKDSMACAVGVARFAQVMKAKLTAKRQENRGGWNKPDECSLRELQTLMRDHFEKGDPVDIANFCMMVWNRLNPKPAVPCDLMTWAKWFEKADRHVAKSEIGPRQRQGTRSRARWQEIEP